MPAMVLRCTAVAPREDTDKAANRRKAGSSKARNTGRRNMGSQSERRNLSTAHRGHNSHHGCQTHHGHQSHRHASERIPLRYLQLLPRVPAASIRSSLAHLPYWVPVGFRLWDLRDSGSGRPIANPIGRRCMIKRHQCDGEEVPCSKEGCGWLDGDGSA